SGDWLNKKRSSSASIAVSSGTLYIDRFVADSVDILERSHPSNRVALRCIQQHEEVDIGLPGYSSQRHMECYQYRAGLNAWGMQNGAALQAIYFSGGG
ncbi:hypothetical protein DFH06DRAFT_912315, partial [Mycena polygramma]